jgi:hypothetical protein
VFGQQDIPFWECHVVSQNGQRKKFTGAMKIMLAIALNFRQSIETFSINKEKNLLHFAVLLP